MEERDLLKNGSGAKDPTAYKAIKSVDTVVSGEVWHTKMGDVLVVSVHNDGPFVTILKLFNDMKESCDYPNRWVEVEAEGEVKYADLSMLSYATRRTFNTEKAHLICVLEDEVISDIKDRIADALGIRFKVEKKDEFSDALDNIMIKHVVPQTEPDYKQRYFELIDRLIEKGRA